VRVRRRAAAEEYQRFLAEVLNRMASGGRDQDTVARSHLALLGPDRHPAGAPQDVVNLFGVGCRCASVAAPGGSVASARLWLAALEFVRSRIERISDPSLVMKGSLAFRLTISIGLTPALCYGSNQRSAISFQLSAISFQRTGNARKLAGGSWQLAANGKAKDKRSAISVQLSAICGRFPDRLIAQSPNCPVAKSPLRLCHCPLPPASCLLLSSPPRPCAFTPSAELSPRPFTPADESAPGKAQGGRREGQRVGRTTAHGAGRDLPFPLASGWTEVCGCWMASITKTAGDVAVGVGHGLPPEGA